MLPDGPLLPVLGNSDNPGNIDLGKGIAQLRAALPLDWTASSPKTREPDFLLEIEAPDKKKVLLWVEVKANLSPRSATQLGHEHAAVKPDRALLLVSPYLSPATRERLRDAGISYVDHTGNISIQASSPGLFIRTDGANIDPAPKERPVRSLRGVKAAQLVRALVRQKAVPGVRQLAELTDSNPGYVSRVLALLEREALIERDAKGRAVSVDWPRLLRYWAQEYPFGTREQVTPCLEPRGIESLMSRLRARTSKDYALSGSLLAARFAPIAPPRLALLYVDGESLTEEALGLRPAESGANVLVAYPNDRSIFAEATEQDGLRFVPSSQAVADLLGSPGRGPAEAEQLIAWMQENEEAWRG
ncbi:MAG: hypothetical protein RL685_5770 [Pseudomonadota bacterium]|jgi:hypothetical protein